jgi:Phage minor capsid protein 2.
VIAVNDYDLAEAIRRIENELIASMIRNMGRHRIEEIGEGYEWSMWQAEMLKSLETYKRTNRRKYKGQFKDINQQAAALIRAAKRKGHMHQEIAILHAIQRGWRYPWIPERIQQMMETVEGADLVQKIPRLIEMLREGRGGSFTGEFLGLNDRKLDALIKATMQDMERAETAVLRKANDDYRKAIFNAQVYVNTGAGTYEQAVDMATKDMLYRGLNCVEYTNGARHTLADYADMAIRTASKRAYLQGEGEMRKEWGIHTVIMNKRGNPCPKCLPFCGKVLIDDVWSGGHAEEGPWPLMSKAIEAGLYHPRCRDSHTTYFPGITTADGSWTEEELEAIGQNSRQEARRQYVDRQIKKYGRLAEYSLDLKNQKKYHKRRKSWESKAGLRYAVSDDIKIHREDTPKRIVDLVEQYTSDKFVVFDEKADHAFSYDPDLDVIVVNPKHPQYQYQEYREVMIHEIAHRIDQNEFGSPMHLDFSRAINETGKKIIKNSTEYNKLFDESGVFAYNSLISDILGCMTDNQVVGLYGHDSQYIGVPGYTELEIFADIFSALYQGDDETVKFIRDELGDVYKEFMKIVGE